LQLGAKYQGEGTCEFSLWAPYHSELFLRVISPQELLIPMKKMANGYWSVKVRGVNPGTQYYFQPNSSQPRPDPASHFQPQGVHGPSQVVDHHKFSWKDNNWRGVPLKEMLIYEIHVGTFTPEGNFAAVISRLLQLKELGINAIEIMPVAQFPGERNWGYDGAYPFSVQNSYGGPDALKELVNKAHQCGIAVILDVVYNHLGPEGNYLAEFAPYFTDKYKTPWGNAINFDDKDNQGTRNYFVQNALHWFENYHVDALRLDAIHGIFDQSPKHILRELAEEAAKYSIAKGRKFYLTAESDLNQEIVVRDQKKGGYGIDAQWNDDFHHAVHALLTKENSGYYADFGTLEQLMKSFLEGFIYSGQYSTYRQKNHGTSSKDIPAERFVAFIQNHDQVGNRMFGERLSTLIPFEALKLAAGVMFISPYIPLLFMGEEFAEETPFLYFISHSDPALAEAVRKGRSQEFAAFGWQKELPNPQAEKTFLDSKIKWEERGQGRHKCMFEFYKKLISLRNQIPALAHLSKKDLKIKCVAENILLLERWHLRSKIIGVMNFDPGQSSVELKEIKGKAAKLLDSSAREFGGPGEVAPNAFRGSVELKLNAHNFLIYKLEEH
jgi:maltooligosyltrehalose trehalohydrolase